MRESLPKASVNSRSISASRYCARFTQAEASELQSSTAMSRSRAGKASQ
jgi:hypothetical protein